MYKALKDQPIPGGNRIGHIPNVPRSFVAPSHHKRPQTLSEIISSFSESYKNPSKHKGLYLHRGNSITQEGRLIRSEFRELISMGCSIITHYYDVLTGELGFRNEHGKFVRFSYEFLAEKLNVSLARVKKFFSFLKERRFITVIEDRKLNERGEWSSNVSRKIIKSSFFIETLGIGTWKKIMKYRKWLEKSAKPVTPKQKETANVLQDMLKQAFKPKTSSKSTYLNPDQEKNFVHVAIERYKEDPSKSLSDHLREIKIAYHK